MAATDLLHDGKTFSRLLSRERNNSSKQGETSFRVFYYGGATGSVPFLWESQPGTPKHKFSDHPLRPLTPPPQYQSSPRASNPLQKKHAKILNSIFPRVLSKKIINASPLCSPPSSSTSSFWSSYSLPSTPFHTGKSISKARTRSIVKFGLGHDEFGLGTNSSTSTLCFSPRNANPSKIVKKVVMSIVGHGNSY